jgi:ABC-2 type transport system ATP-binding protein
MEHELAIYAKDLQKSYGSVHALRGVELSVKRGEIFGFLGPNGAGKTTTIRCMLDLIRPDGGELRVLGMDPQHDSVGVRSRIGYLPSEPQIEGNLTGEMALRYFSTLRGVRFDRQQVAQLAMRLDIDLGRQVKNLSHGNKQKVAVIAALMHRPDLLILDEPTTGLDPLIQREVLRLVKEAQSAGATTFFSSHIISEVETLADRVGIIRQGVVVEVADTKDLVSRSMRRARLRFSEQVDPQRFGNLPGVELLSTDSNAEILLQITGSMNALVNALAGTPLIEIDTERPSLEELFLAYYEGDREEHNQ